MKCKPRFKIIEVLLSLSMLVATGCSLVEGPEPLTKGKDEAQDPIMEFSKPWVSLEAGPSIIGDQIVEEARKILGTPYIYGAESWAEGGFDCSGLTQYVYSQLNIKIPRTASNQWARISRKVTVPRPGDLIAFNKVEEGGVYHVGIYIGNDQMIHAPQPGDVVKVSNLDWWFRNGWVQGFLRPYSDQKRQPINLPLDPEFVYK